MNSPKPDIQVSGSIIAEFPTDEDARTFNFGKEIPILPLRTVVAFPGMPIPVSLTNEHDVQLAESIYNSHSCVLAIPLKQPDSEANRLKDFYSYGTVCKIGKVLKMPDMDPVVFLLGGPRARLKKLISKTPVVTGEISVGTELKIDDNYETNYLLENVKSSFDKLLSFLPDQEKQRVSFEVEDMADHPVAGVFFMIANSPLTHEEKAHLLASKNFKVLLEDFLRYLDLALQKLEIQANIHRRTHQALNDQQRNHFLQQQLRNIQEELGEGEASDMGELLERAKKMPWGKEARAHFDKELKKLERFNPSNPEYSIQYSYLDTLLSLPWDKYSPDSFSLSKVEKILDRDHFGLEEVKERIIEHMAVLKLRNDMKVPIICLNGPPGVRKTSLGKSIADALGREYTRVSLGGLHDEDEIRGHRRT